MNHPVLLKGNSIGLTMVLDPEMKFEQLKAAICEKFIQAGNSHPNSLKKFQGLLPKRQH